MTVVLKRRAHILDEFIAGPGERYGHLVNKQPQCWCNPVVQDVPGGEVVFHGDELTAELGLSPILLAEPTDAS